MIKNLITNLLIIAGITAQNNPSVTVSLDPAFPNTILVGSTTAGPTTLAFITPTVLIPTTTIETNFVFTLGLSDPAFPNSTIEFKVNIIRQDNDNFKIEQEILLLADANINYPGDLFINADIGLLIDVNYPNSTDKYISTASDSVRYGVSPPTYGLFNTGPMRLTIGIPNHSQGLSISNNIIGTFANDSIPGNMPGTSISTLVCATNSNDRIPFTSGISEIISTHLQLNPTFPTINLLSCTAPMTSSNLSNSVRRFQVKFNTMFMDASSGNKAGPKVAGFSPTPGIFAPINQVAGIRIATNKFSGTNYSVEGYLENSLAQFVNNGTLIPLLLVGFGSNPLYQSGGGQLHSSTLGNFFLYIDPATAIAVIPGTGMVQQDLNLDNFTIPYLDAPNKTFGFNFNLSSIPILPGGEQILVQVVFADPINGAVNSLSTDVIALEGN